MKNNKNIQNRNYALWLVKNTDNDNETVALIYKYGQPCNGKSVTELLALQYVAKNTNNNWNVDNDMIGNGSVDRFTGELLCEGDDRRMLLKMKKSFR
jgi:hypothetical protein